MATAEELRSRLARIVAAGDAERRRFERELHDGAQQELIALAVGLQLARRLSDSDPDAAKQLLEEIGHDVHGALDRVRELATQIYPPLLDSRGLEAALRAAGVAVQIEGEPLPRYAAEIEGSVYFDCVEAARGAPAEIRMWSDDEALRFELLCDGRPPDRGVGDRIVALGGSVSVADASVSGTIPAQPLSAR